MYTKEEYEIAKQMAFGNQSNKGYSQEEYEIARQMAFGSSIPKPAVTQPPVQQVPNPVIQPTGQSVIQQPVQPAVKPALPPVVQNLTEIQNKNPLETSYGNLDQVPSEMLTPEQKESAEHSRRLSMGLPLTGGAESNNFKNVFAKKTPIRDFGVKVGRALTPKFIENRMYGTERERELLKANEVLTDPYELADQLKSGKIGIDEYQEKVEAYNAYQDATARKARGDRNKRLLAELGIAVGTMGIGSIGNLGAKVAPHIAKGVYNALKVAGVGRKAKPVIGLSSLGKTKDVAKAISKKAGVIGGHLVDDVTVGGAMGGATNLAEQAMGIDTEEGVLGATGQGALAGGTVGTGLRGLGRLSKVVSRTDVAKKVGNKIDETREAVADSLEEQGKTGLADAVRTAPAKWNRFWNAKRKAPWSKKTQDSLTHDENISKIVNQHNTADYRDLEQEYKVINNSLTEKEQEYALKQANKRRDVDDNFIEEPEVIPETPTENVQETPKSEPKNVDEEVKSSTTIDFAQEVQNRKQRTNSTKEKALNFRERIKQRKERTNTQEEVVTPEENQISQRTEDDLSHVKEEIGTNIPKQEETPLKTQSDMSGEDNLVKAQLKYNKRSKTPLKEAHTKEYTHGADGDNVTRLESGEQERLVVGKPKTKGEENVYQDQASAVNDEVDSYEGKKDALKGVKFYDTTGKRVDAVEPNSGQIKNEYSVVRRNADGSYIVRRNSIKEIAERDSNRKTNARRHNKELQDREYNDYINRKEIEEATSETRLDEYNDNIQEADTEYNDNFAQYSNDEVARFIEDCKKTSTREAIARKQQELGYDDNAIAEFQEKLMVESDRRYTKNYKVGEADKKLADEQEAEYIMDVVNDFAVANKGAKKTRKETFTATEEDASYSKIASISKKKETDTSAKHAIINDKRVLKEESIIQELQKEKAKLLEAGHAENSAKVKLANRKISEAINSKNRAIADYNKRLYEQPKNKVRDNFVNAKDKQAEYDSYIEALTDSKYLGYKNNSNIAQSALDKINEVATEVGGIKTVSSIQKAVNKKGDDVMKSLKEANRIAEETGDLSVGRQIIDDNKDLLDYNLDSDYKAKKGGFDMSELERHYDLSYATSKGQLDALENKSTRRKALKDIYSDNINAKKEFLQGEIEKTKKAGDVKKATKLEAEYHNIELFDSASYLDNLSDADIEHLARARARKIYADNRRIIRRHLVDYDHANKAVYDKNWDDVNRHGKGEVNKPVYRHYYENDMAEYHDPEGLFTSFDNKMRNFLDAEHWNNDFNPWRYNDSKAITPEQVKLTKDTTKTDVVKARYEHNKFEKENRITIATINKEMKEGWYRKDASGNWLDEQEIKNNYYQKKIKPLEEKVAELENIVKTSKDKANIARATDELKNAKKTLEEYKIYKKYTELKAKYEQTKQAYNDANSAKSKLAKFVNKTKLGIFRKADNPFLKDGADYRDTPTGALDREAIHKDMKLMRDEKFMKAKAKEEAIRTGRTVKSILEDYRAKLQEMETLYGEVADNFNYRNLNTFKGFKTGTRAQELRASKEKSDIELADMFDENPNVTVEFTKDPDRTHGDYAEVVFDKDGKHTILINEVPKGMTEADLIREEWEHIRQFANGEYDKLGKAMKEADKAHHKYNTNKSTFKEIRKLQKQGVSDEDIVNALSDTQKKQITDLEKAKTKQKATKAEKEAHNANYSNDNRPRVLGRSTSSDGATNEKYKTEQSDNGRSGRPVSGKSENAERNSEGLSNISDGQSSGSGLTPEDLHGKSLNKSKTYDDLIKRLISENEVNTTYKGVSGRKKAVNDLTTRLTNTSKLLDATASEFGISQDQQINRILMTDGLNYNVRLAKGTKQMAWNEKPTEQAGSMGAKSQDDKPLTASEQYFANKLELQHRTNILSATQHVEDAFAKPITDGKVSDGYVPVNKKLLNITLYNRYGEDFYKGITNGEESIAKMFSKDEKARKAWLSVYKEINSAKADYQIPKHIFKKMMLDTGETAQVKLQRYGKLKGSLKYAQASYDALTANFVKGVLSLNPKWAVGNSINDAVKMFHKEQNVGSFAKHFYQALKLDEKHLPSLITENNMFEVEKAVTAYQRFTGNNNLDCTLNLLSGRFISNKECKTLLGKMSATGANVVATPMWAVNKIADAVMSANSKIQTHYRKMIWVKYLDDYQNARCKNIIQNITKQNAYFNMLSKKVASNRKLRECAIDEIFSTLGDYSTASPFEQEIVKRIAPFYKWHRHIFKYYADEARRNPSKLALHALYMNKIMDDDVESKHYQRGGIPVSNDLKINPMRYLDITDTAKELVDSPLSVLHPIPKSVIEAGLGKDTFTGKALKSPYYETDYRGDVIDLKTGDYVKDKRGRKVDRLPFKESWKNIPVTMGRMYTMSDSPTISVEKMYGMVDNYKAKKYSTLDKTGKAIEYKKFADKQKNFKANKGKTKTYDKLYDTAFGGYNHGDKYVAKNKIKEKYATEYSLGEKAVRVFVPAHKQTPLSKKDKKAQPYEILANNERLFNVIPTPKSHKYRKEAELIRKQENYKKKKEEK